MQGVDRIERDRVNGLKGLPYTGQEEQMMLPELNDPCGRHHSIGVLHVRNCHLVLYASSLPLQQ